MLSILCKLETSVLRRPEIIRLRLHQEAVFQSLLCLSPKATSFPYTTWPSKMETHRKFQNNGRGNKAHSKSSIPRQHMLPRLLGGREVTVGWSYLCLFPRVTLANSHKLGGLKHDDFIPSLFWRPEALNQGVSWLLCQPLSNSASSIVKLPLSLPVSCVSSFVSYKNTCY